MKLGRSLKIGAWLLVGLNLLMALGSIWVFMRMTPAIEVIIARNERSLQASEDMLLVLATGDGDTLAGQQRFDAALLRAQENITEPQEADCVDTISGNYSAAIHGDQVARSSVLSALVRLAHINREAMVSADKRAKQYGYAGAWGVVFMALGVFVAALLFMRSMRNNLIEPLEQIHEVISAQLDGDTIRRCAASHARRDIKNIYEGLNELLDNHQNRAAGSAVSAVFQQD